MSKYSRETGIISHKEAYEILSRFINSYFNSKKEHARFSIPVDFRRDDDIRLTAYIEQQEALLVHIRDLAVVHWVYSEDNCNDILKMVNDILKEIISESNDPAVSRVAAEAFLYKKALHTYHADIDIDICQNCKDVIIEPN